MVNSEIVIYCDGACLGNPGPGGYAALLMLKNKPAQEKVVAGYELSTTNNRMELRGAIAGLSSLKRKCHATIFCDSQYVVKGMTEWIIAWQKSGFKNTRNKDIANIDLWRELVDVANKHMVVWRWVRGHAGNDLNERVDEIAREQALLAQHYMTTGHL